MKRLVEKLAKALMHPADPSPQFIESLCKYAVPVAPQQMHIEGPLGLQSAKALALYKKLPPGSAAQRAVYVLLSLCASTPGLEEELRLALHRIALGFPVPQVANLPAVRQALPVHIYHVLQRIYEAALRYKQLCIESAAPRSQTHAFFLQACEPTIREYERQVVAADRDFLRFHAAMYPLFVKLRDMWHVNNLITDASNGEDTSIAQAKRIKSPNSEHCAAEQRHRALFAELQRYGDVAYRVHNECAVSYMLSGAFCDPHAEFFVKDHALDYGKIPSIIDKALAERIAYIGKYVCFLRHTGHPAEIAQLAKSIDLSRKDAAAKVDAMLRYTNGLIFSHFIEKHRIGALLDFIRAVFLGKRGDFIEYLFASLKQSRNSTRKDALAILEAALADAFPGNPLAANIDIFVKSGMDAAGSELTEAFGLYCRMDYPVTFLLDEEFVLKLAYIYKFLWKLKKVEHLVRRVNSLKYSNFVQRLIFYVFNEAISKFRAAEVLEAWDAGTLAMDVLRARLNRQLDSIMDALFLNTQAKRIEYLLFYMDKAFVQAGKTGVLDDGEIQASLAEFYSSAGASLENTYLYSLRDFLQCDG